MRSKNSDFNLCCDLSFRITGISIPKDHGYGLFSALSNICGNKLHGAEWLAIHPILGDVKENSIYFRNNQSYLKLRIDPKFIPDMYYLCGKTIQINSNLINIGNLGVYPLKPCTCLRSWFVIIKNREAVEPDSISFKDAVKRQLDRLGVFHANIEIGKEHWLRAGSGNHKGSTKGFSVVIDNLSDEDSMIVQQNGIGAKQRMGCGIFNPMRRNNEI
jgi:CRISPR-associated protein Cas6